MFDRNNPNLSRRKKLALDFMDNVLHGTNLDFMNDHMRKDYIQHTPGIGQGREGVRRYVEQVASKRDRRHEWRPVMMFEDGDVVILIKWIPKAWICDIMRFDENDKLAEHWDVVQAWPEGAPEPEDRSAEDLTRFKALFGMLDT